ncbi:MAG: O-antigen ligase family protein [Rhodocyclaceae bacterium]|nr:O-antigen ligase family protein [Rhodocyclaceae bacterium]
MNPSPTFSRPHNIACGLTIAIAVGLLFSPPLANLAELLLVALVFTSGELRRRVILAWHQPLVKAALAFWLVTGVGVFYSIAPTSISLSMWSGWRKLLFLPLALALFEHPVWKRRFALSLIAVTVAAAVVSFATWRLQISINGAEPGVLLRNHATQGMVFAVAAFAAAILALRGGESGMPRLLAGAAILLAGDIALVTPGRSGYLVLLVCTACLMLAELMNRQKNWKSAAGAVLMLAAIVSALALAPTSRERITLAFHEMTQYKEAQQETSMGIRVFFWKNTLQLISERPLSGYGTGAFGTAYGRLVADRPGLAGTPAGDPHNQYMKIATEHGLPGLLVFLAMLGAALRQTVPPPWRLLGLGVLAAWCATSLANSHFSTFAEGTFIYLWLGVMLAQARKTPPNQTSA